MRRKLKKVQQQLLLQQQQREEQLQHSNFSASPSAFSALTVPAVDPLKQQQQQQHLQKQQQEDQQKEQQVKAQQQQQLRRPTNANFCCAQVVVPEFAATDEEDHFGICGDCCKLAATVRSSHCSCCCCCVLEEDNSCENLYAIYDGMSTGKNVSNLSPQKQNQFSHCQQHQHQHQQQVQQQRQQQQLLKRSAVKTFGTICIFALIFIFFNIPQLNAQFVGDCSDAPNAALRRVCRVLRQIDRSARRRFRADIAAQRASPGESSIATNSVVEQTVRPPAPPPAAPWQQPIPVPANARGQWATHPYDCMTLQCLCPFFGGQMAADGNCYLASGAPLAMAYRKEYRMMSDNERQRFHYVLAVLKQNGEYDRLSAQHLLVGVASGAHSGPGFLPWHREYLKRVEIAIRLIDPELAIPYWDSVMDGYLPNPADSIMHSPAFMGETDWNGFVVNGPFAFWRTLEGRSAILRNLGREGQLFTEAQLNSVMQQTNVEYVMAYTVPLPGCPYPLNFQAIEYTHSNIHLWLGGDMKPPATSANDPIFFLHHSFVDLVWESWRQLRQPRWVRESAYTPDLPMCANPLHFSYAQMVPFNLVNRDGLSNSYTDQMYRYAPRPGCSAQVPHCGSAYLFCDLAHGFPHCVAKVKMGGWCAGFEGQDACYNGLCWFGRCVPGAPPQQNARFGAWASRTRLFASGNSSAMATEVVAANGTATVPNAAAASRRIVPFADCYDRNPCCERWTRVGECRRNAQYMREYCRASCAICTRSFNANNECADRHPTCAQWARNGECTHGNALLFMQENCRQSCGFCDTRKCSSALGSPPPVAAPQSRAALKNSLTPPLGRKQHSLARSSASLAEKRVAPHGRRLQPPAAAERSSPNPLQNFAQNSTPKEPNFAPNGADEFRRRV